MHHSEQKGLKRNAFDPWSTNELLREMHKKYFLKKKADSTNDPLSWKPIHVQKVIKLLKVIDVGKGNWA